MTGCKHEQLIPIEDQGMSIRWACAAVGCNYWTDAARTVPVMIQSPSSSDECLKIELETLLKHYCSAMTNQLPAYLLAEELIRHIRSLDAMLQRKREWELAGSPVVE